MYDLQYNKLYKRESILALHEGTSIDLYVQWLNPRHQMR